MAALLLPAPIMMLMLGFTVLTIVLTYIFFAKKCAAADVATSTRAITNNNGVQPLPPSPPKLPILGNLHQLTFHPHRSLRSLSERHGPLMLLRLGRLSVLVVSSPSIVREIIQTQDHIFTNRPSLKATSKLLYHGRDIAFAPYGEYWREMKKVAILHLLCSKKVKTYKHVREEEVAFMMKEVEQAKVVDLTERFNALSMNVTGRAVISKAVWRMSRGDELRSLIIEGSKLIGEFYVGDYIPWLGKMVGLVTGFEGRVRKAFERSDQYLEELVREHRKVREKRKEEGRDSDVADECFLDILLNTKEQLNCEGIVVDSESIKAVIEVISFC